ncbi:MAG: nicotinate (nicotinamide) nucleotide adenylyltransferase [Clostridiales bacterium GWF2_38_85]|nr:MAG: nicotinate (nicotinamide) nucleotide adenylyltransferase [Clostridiales bacterium GWF2_38_85]HBL83464.1 nicotinate (nicotinamide) nucleotide adenylyltransferase [Clostridiales bacterium]
MKLLGIFGGTFNPPHIGHYRAAKAFNDEFKLDKLIIMPSNIPPHKMIDKNSPSPEQRYELCRLAFNTLGEVSNFELSNNSTSYTYNTVRHFEELYPEHKIVLCIGDDMLFIFEKWYRFKYLLTHVKLAVTNRSQLPEKQLSDECERLRNKYKADIMVLVYTPTVISSTEIRAELKSGKNIENYLDKRVVDYIKANNLYQ